MIGQRQACELDCVLRMVIVCLAGEIREQVFFCVRKRSHFNSLPKQKHSSEIPPATQGSGVTPRLMAISSQIGFS